jgi:hypothetical protein
MMIVGTATTRRILGMNRKRWKEMLEGMGKPIDAMRHRKGRNLESRKVVA